MKVFKSINGWKAESFFKLDDRHSLHVTTSKRSNGQLATTATRVTDSEDGMSYSFAVYQDFYKTLVTSATRVTEKAVKSQHEKALEGLDDLKKEVENFYNKTPDTP